MELKSARSLGFPSCYRIILNIFNISEHILSDRIPVHVSFFIVMPYHHGIFVLLSLALASSLPAQVLRYESRFEDGAPSLEAPLSDIDGDGAPEYFGLVNQGGVVSGVYYSMEKQQALVTFTIPPSLTLESDRLSDLNSDGLVDIVYQSWDPVAKLSHAVARSGLDGSILWTRTDLPDSLAAPILIGDHDGDGVDDFVANLLPNEVIWLSGKDGSTLQRNVNILGNDFYSWIEAAGDLDRDGIPDYFATERFGAHWALSGATDKLLFTIIANGQVKGVGDVSGDGQDDYVVTSGSTFDCIENSVDIYTGSPPQLLGEIPLRTQGDPSWRVEIKSNDWNDDGVNELLLMGGQEIFPGAGCPPGDPFPIGYFRIHSFANGLDLYSTVAAGDMRVDKFFGWFFEQDYDGDQRPDVLVKGVSGVRAFSTKPHLESNIVSISQSSGGALQFSLDATSRYSQLEGFLLVGVGEPRRGSRISYLPGYGLNWGIALPFGVIPETHQIWQLRGSGKPAEQRFSLSLDADGKGVLDFTFAPGEIPARLIGKKLRFCFLMPDDQIPELPESSTEAVVIEVLH